MTFLIRVLPALYISFMGKLAAFYMILKMPHIMLKAIISYLLFGLCKMFFSRINVKQQLYYNY